MRNSMKLSVSGPTVDCLLRLHKGRGCWVFRDHSKRFSSVWFQSKKWKCGNSKHPSRLYVFAILRYCAKLAFQDSIVQGGHGMPFQPHKGTWLLLCSDWSLLITALVPPIMRVSVFSVEKKGQMFVLQGWHQAQVADWPPCTHTALGLVSGKALQSQHSGGWSGGPEVEGHLGLYTEFKVSLGYMGPGLKRKKRVPIIYVSV